MINLSSQKIPNKSKDTAVGFVIGALAACGAVTFTNPIEVVKTRLQLQGELVRTGSLSPSARPYHNSFQALKVVFENEGVRGLQRGLSVAYLYQVCLNGSRLGLYEPLHSGVIHSLQLTSHHSLLAAGIFAGGVSGMIGALLGSPLYLIKTRRQSYSPVFKQIGYQHKMMSSWSALSHIYHVEGIKGLYRGASAAMARASVGSAVQMPSYMFGKDLMMTEFALSDTISTHFGASMVTGFLVALAMNPFDVLSTRLYNQGVDPVSGKGLLYKNLIDCFVKLIHTEGVQGLYKGFFAHFLRIG
ncbi:mitochondrial carrier domain-containing protein [Chlamydoabsidia padenii]|nr:mitochondrial carrier domain-containing protein [Chlamydoabsidia padenii]